MDEKTCPNCEHRDEHGICNKLARFDIGTGIDTVMQTPDDFSCSLFKESKK